jgi:methionyl-tRNA formyltransferase
MVRSSMSGLIAFAFAAPSSLSAQGAFRPSSLSAQRALRPSPQHGRTKPSCRAFVVVASAASASPARLVFFGTPEVAATSLQRLYNAAAASRSAPSPFELVAVVSQPPSAIGRKRVLTKSPVHALADTLSIPEILTPASARDPAFLATLKSLSPDLCVTAAYGNFLPQAFLDIPRRGTVNIHPSLLPHFRGAAPVPRALEAGVNETGVSVAYTQLSMDSGPIIAQPRLALNGDEHAPALLQTLFDMGTESLIAALPDILSGAAVAAATPQNDAHASHAPKLSKNEARLTFTENAAIVHNKVRALAGWPGTWADFVVRDPTAAAGVEPVIMRVKVIETRIIRATGGMCLGVHDVKLADDAEYLDVTCDDGSKIAITTVQPPGKKPMSAKSFWNGLRGRELGRNRVPH